MNTSSLILSVVTFIYGLSAVFYVITWIFKKPLAGKLATWTAIAGIAGNVAGIILRWVESYQMGYGHAPLSNLYESLVFFACAIAGLYIFFIERRYKNQVIGCFVVPIACLAMAYASLSPDISDRIQPLIPALKSNWLIAHVITCFLGYAGFAVAFGISCMYIYRQVNTEKALNYKVDYAVVFAACLLYTLKVIVKTGLTDFFSKISVWFYIKFFAIFIFIKLAAYLLLKYKDRLMEYFPDISVLDDLTHKMIQFGFLFLSVGIITGAVWANSAWGRYWGWDPKETWSLITWFIYATLLHARLMRGWSGKKIAYISIIGFVAVLFTYFGVNLLPGLHSYGSQ